MPEYSGRGVIELRGVTKRFPGVIANDDLSIQFEPAKVHALLGENGAGKSTLISMLAGMQQPDAGVIVVDGTAVRLSSPRQALNLGIGTVYQHTLLIRSLTVLENLMLGSPWWKRYNRAATLRRFEELSQVLTANIDPDAEVGRLSLGQQQQVEIMRALWHGERVLILDEPTSMLTPQGVRDLFEVVRRIRDRGVAVIFITHKLREAYELADHVTVLRLGRKVGEIPAAALGAKSESEIVDLIVGMMFGTEEQPGKTERADEDAILTGAAHIDGGARRLTPDKLPSVVLRGAETRGQRGESPLRGADLEIRPGEILGVAGVDGNGQKHLAEVLAGQRALVSGTLTIDGVDVTAGDVLSRRAQGVRYITDERLGEGTVGSHSIAINLALKSIGIEPHWSPAGFTRWRLIRESAKDAIRTHDIRTPSETTPIALLSGGNIQKALLARELSPDAKLIVFNKPTYGLDLQTTVLARRRIRAGAGSENAAILVISNELDELAQTCDRIAVISDGRMVGVVENGPGAEEQIGRLMIGFSQRRAETGGARSPTLQGDARLG